MEQTEIRQKLLNFICETFFVEEDEIDLDNSMIDDGIIDSFGLVEISAFLQRTFSIIIVEEEMIRENFGSVNKIAAFTQSKMQVA